MKDGNLLSISLSVEEEEEEEEEDLNHINIFNHRISFINSCLPTPHQLQRLNST
jgi:hypothetical protein